MAVTSYTAHGLSISKSHVLSPISYSSTTMRHATHLNLGPIDDLSDYGKQKNESELDTLRSKREQLKKQKLANIKPNDDEPKVKDMTDDEIAAMFATKNNGEDEEGGGMDVDALFARDYVPDFKIKRQSSSRGLSSGDSGGVLDDPNADDENDVGLFIDWTEDYNDENELHIPNRLGFTTVDWGNGKKGFVSGKLKKKDRKMGKFNKTDLRVSTLCMCVRVCMRGMKGERCVCVCCAYLMLIS